MPAKPKTAGSSAKDELIMNTNNSCIVSKRSVEKLYHKQDHGFRHFVKKFQRRSPLINRGYWLRMRAIECAVRTFIEHERERRPSLRPVIVNLGCGYDILPFKLLSEDPDMATFVDVDYAELMQRKCKTILGDPGLVSRLGPASGMSARDQAVLFTTSNYIALGCDLSDVSTMQRLLGSVTSSSDAIFFVAEVSMTYMDVAAADAVVKWASTFENGQFCLLEQCLPEGEDTPFAGTMLKHFNKLQSPLKTVLRYPTIFDQEARFQQHGWQRAQAHSLWDLWNDEQFLSEGVIEELDKVEPFDEWEEFILFAQHYFLLTAHHDATPTHTPREPSSSSARASPSPRRGRTSQPNNVSNRYKVELMPLSDSNRLKPRRQAASFSVGCSNSGKGAIVVHGGQSLQGRLSSADSLTKQYRPPPSTSNPSPQGSISFLQAGAEPPNLSSPNVECICHTITAISPVQSLLVGGRTSPERASSTCLLRIASRWKQVHCLPEGRFRHTAVAIDLGPNADTKGVLVFGGKASDGRVLTDWLMWTSQTGWRDIFTSPEPAPRARFGASMCTLHSRSGYLLGGIGYRGVVLRDFWQWELLEEEHGWRIKYKRVWERPPKQLLHYSLCRFGASLVGTSDHSVYLIGGVARRYIPGASEIVRISDDYSATGVPIGNSVKRPMLVGHSAELLIDGDGEELVIIGGGATCFSFGTYWNDSCFHVALHDRHSTFSWQTLPPPAPSPERRPAACRQSSSYGPRNGTDGHGYTVLQRELNDGADFDCVQNKAKPVVFHNLDIGPCVHTWNPDHMRSAVGADRSVVLHEAPEPNLSFVSKNFTYSTTSFSGFISRIENGDHLYLRSLAASSPSTTPTHLNDDFPNLAKDFNLPPELSFVIENMHSSPLRISGAVNMWLHYDVMANIYCQITGQKRVVLFPPYLATQLEFAPGASSSGLQVFDCKGEVCEDMGLRRLKHYVTDLKPGDILFIPPCWPHATTSAFTPTSETAIDDSNNDRRATIESCVTPSPAPMKSQISTAVNVFFKQLPPNAYAAGRDVYGNRDLQAYETGRRDVAKIVKAFKGLPRGTAGFYLRRLAAELEEAVADGENQ